MPTIDRQSIVQWSRTPVAAAVGDEVVLMHLANGRCYGLGSVGTDIWNKLSEPVEVNHLIQQLCDEYAADPAVLASDVLETLQQYAAEGLIEVVDRAL